MSHMLKPTPRSGFTLVEISIVMVIVGLLIGGVLIGRDLIRAAEIRSQISDLESYQTAYSNFRMRFSGIPGDLRNARDVLPIVDFPAIANGDGDGVLEDGAGNSALFTGEIAQYWMQLSSAKMIEGTYFSTSSKIGKGYPATAFGRGGVVAKFDPAIASNSTPHSANILFLGMSGVVDSGTDETIANEAILYPEDAWKIDEKMDDGKPYFGIIRARAANYNDPSYLDVFLAPDSLPTPIQFVFNMLVPNAYAMSISGSSVSEDKACVYISDPSNTASLNTATYAYRTNGVNCLLSFELRK